MAEKPHKSTWLTNSSFGKDICFLIFHMKQNILLINFTTLFWCHNPSSWCWWVYSDTQEEHLNRGNAFSVVTTCDQLFWQFLLCKTWKFMSSFFHCQQYGNNEQFPLLSLTHTYIRTHIHKIISHTIRDFPKILISISR